MPIKSKQNTKIEVLFPIVLFLIFTLSALVVILFAARIYQRTIEDSNAQYQQNISLSYLSQKVRQSDANGMVSLGSFDKCDALMLKEDIEGVEYTTFIYSYDGYVRELFVATNEQSSIFSAESGKRIFAAKELDFDIDENGLLTISATDENDIVNKTCISIHSKNSIPSETAQASEEISEQQPEPVTSALPTTQSPANNTSEEYIVLETTTTTETTTQLVPEEVTE